MRSNIRVPGLELPRPRTERTAVLAWTSSRNIPTSRGQIQGIYLGVQDTSVERREASWGKEVAGQRTPPPRRAPRAQSHRETPRKTRGTGLRTTPPEQGWSWGISTPPGATTGELLPGLLAPYPVGLPAGQKGFLQCWRRPPGLKEQRRTAGRALECAGRVSPRGRGHALQCPPPQPRSFLCTDACSPSGPSWGRPTYPLTSVAPSRTVVGGSQQSSLRSPLTGSTGLGTSMHTGDSETWKEQQGTAPLGLGASAS